ncbi:MAG: hypothetical protein ACRD0K_14170, partial [Egibacteraceae bacterium]
MRGCWRIADADWNRWADGLGDYRSWPVGYVHDFGGFVRALDEVGYEGVAAFDLYGAVCSGRWTGAGA